MNIPPELTPPIVQLAAGGLFLAALVHAAVRAPWDLLRANRLQHIFGASIPLLLPFWSMRAGVHPGLDIHLLGAMALVLVFGPRLALVALTGVILALTAVGGYGWANLGVNGLVGAAIPVLVAARIQRLVWTWLPRHLFVYLFGNAFFGAMLTAAAAVCATALLLWSAGNYSLSFLAGEYLILLPLIMFMEGFVTGLILTMLVVYRPDWVRSMNDRVYLDYR